MDVMKICDSILNDGFLTEKDVAIIEDYIAYRTYVDSCKYRVLNTSNNNKYIRFGNDDSCGELIVCDNTCSRYNGVLYNFNSTKDSGNSYISITDVVREMESHDRSYGIISSKEIYLEDSYNEVHLAKFINEFRSCSSEDIMFIVKFIKMCHKIKAVCDRGIKLSIHYHCEFNNDDSTDKKLVYGYSLVL